MKLDFIIWVSLYYYFIITCCINVILFYFILGDGENDQMMCFCCSQGLKDWEDDDEPWTEHARWSPTCSYVLLSKGKHFVDAACGYINNNTKINQEARICSFNFVLKFTM